MKDNRKQNSLAYNAVFSVIYRLLSILFPLISAGYVARILTPDGVGRYADASNNVSYFVMLGSLGIQAYAIREIAKRRENTKDRDKFFSEMLVLNAILTAFAIICFVICYQFTPLFNGDKFMYFVCAFAIAINFINIDWFFQGTEDFKFIAIRSFVVKLIGLIAIFVFIRSSEDLYTYALICVLTNGGHYLLNIIRALRTAKISFRKVQFKAHMKPLVFLALCTVSAELYSRLDITMLGIMNDNYTVACYTYAQKIIFMVVTTVIAITAVFMPRLSYYYENDNAGFNKLIKFGVDLMILISFPVSLGLVSVAEPLITLWLGDQYYQAVPCLIILSLMIPLKCLGDLTCYQVLLCAGKEKYLMITHAVTVLINFLLNLVLIPAMECEGASIASLISEFLGFLIVYSVARKYQSYKLNGRNAVIVIVSSVVMAVAVIFFAGIFENMMIKLFGGALLGVVIFLVINVIFRNTFLFKDIKAARKSSREQSR